MGARPRRPCFAVAGTFFTSPATGIGKRGIDLQKCYEGQYAANGKRQGFGVYKYANGYLTYEGEYVNGQKHGEPLCHHAGRLTHAAESSGAARV